MGVRINRRIRLKLRTEVCVVSQSQKQNIMNLVDMFTYSVYSTVLYMFYTHDHLESLEQKTF